MFLPLLLIAISIGYSSTAYAAPYRSGAVSHFDVTCSGESPGTINICVSKPILDTKRTVAIETTRPPLFNLVTKMLERGAGNHPILFIPEERGSNDLASSVGNSFHTDLALLKRHISLPATILIPHVLNHANYSLTTFNIFPKCVLISALRIRPPPDLS